jgi:hypothetical protein
MNIALYRMYYGEDFIEKSVMSIIDDIDKIFIMFTDRPWNGANRVIYKGNTISIPCPIDNGVNIAKDLEMRFPDKVKVIYHYHPVPDNQFTIMYENLKLRKLVDTAKVVMLMEPDMVWPEGKLGPILNYLSEREFTPMCTYQIEFWKSDKYMIPVRNRPGAIFHNVSGGKPLPITEKNGSTPFVIYMDEFIHNYGFCMKPYNMFWKLLIGLSVSKSIGDSIPNEDWYEKKWLTWNFQTNNKDLEISKGYEHFIPYALKHDPVYYNFPGKYIHFPR